MTAGTGPVACAGISTRRGTVLLAGYGVCIALGKLTSYSMYVEVRSASFQSGKVMGGGACATWGCCAKVRHAPRKSAQSMITALSCLLAMVAGTQSPQVSLDSEFDAALTNVGLSTKT